MNIEIKKRENKTTSKRKQVTFDSAAFWQDKTAEQLAKEQGIKPIKTAEDLAMIFGGFEDWDDVDEFLKEIRPEG